MHIIENFIRFFYKKFLPRPLRSSLKIQFELLRSGREPQITEAPEALRILVLAPHMDDEVFGCGGTLALCIKKTCQVSVVYFTNGNKGYDENKFVGESDNKRREREARLIEIRKKEARHAAEIIGFNELIFLDFDDEALDIQADKIDKLVNILQHARPQAVFLPFLNDLHPDHWMTNCLFIKAAIRAKLMGDISCWGYEVWSPLFNNTVVDITDVIKEKREAMKAYVSQISDLDYPRVILGLNTYRSLMTRQGSGFAEGFYVAELDVYRGIYEASLVR